MEPTGPSRESPRYEILVAGLLLAAFIVLVTLGNPKGPIWPLDSALILSYLATALAVVVLAVGYAFGKRKMMMLGAAALVAATAILWMCLCLPPVDSVTAP